MSGLPMLAAQMAICAFYANVLDDHVLEGNTLITFDSHADVHDLTWQDSSAIDHTVRSVYACGATSFQAALTAVKERIESSRRGCSFFVAFFTDGCDTCELSLHQDGFSREADFSHGNLLEQVSLHLNSQLMTSNI